MLTLRGIPAELHGPVSDFMKDLLAEGKPCYEVANAVNQKYPNLGLQLTAGSVYAWARRRKISASGQRGPSTAARKAASDNPYAGLSSRTSEEAQLRELFGRWEHRQMVLPITDVHEGERAIYLSDLQVPFHDVPLLGAINRFMEDFQPDRIFYDGDTIDLYTISTFDKNPSRRFHLEDEVKQARGVYDDHGKIVPHAKRYHLDGNHEFRLIRELIRAGGEFYGLMDEDDGDPLLSIPKILGLRRRNIEYIPWPGRVDYKGFTITHGPPPRRMSYNVKHCAKMMSELVRSSGICGDFHRSQIYSWVGDEGQSQAWIVQGCLCRLDPDYAPFPDWQQSFTISVVLNGLVHPLLIPVFDRRFYAEGREYTY